MEDFNYLHDNFKDSSRTHEKTTVVLVEDDRSLGISIKKYLEKVLSVEVIYFQSAHDCLEGLTEQKPFCLITDISLEKSVDGLALIDLLREKSFEFVSIAITGFASIETAIAATKKGVFHYLTKPFELENLANLVVEGFEKGLNRKIEKPLTLSNLKEVSNKGSARIFKDFKIEPPKDDEIFCGMVGRSETIKEVFNRIKIVASSNSTVLINGPSGTGKELVAQALHKLSARNENTLVSVNCGAIPSELLESELFGHTKGSFTGAISDRKGRFEIANKGTIFLDEIGDMPLLLQVKLLRVLQSRQIEPVGSTSTKTIDTRIITATHRNLEKLVNNGDFREDLFYRLNVIPIYMPALKERREDIPLLIAHFLSKFVSADGSNSLDFDAEALELLMSYEWPGNVRELENLIERLVILKGGNTVIPEDLPSRIYENNPKAKSLYSRIFELPEEGIDLKQVIQEIESSLINQAIEKTNGNKNQASKLLCLNRTTLIEKMKKRNVSTQLHP